MLGLNKYLIGPIVAGCKSFNQTFSNSAGITDSAQKTYTHFTKKVGASAGSAGLAKGAVDCAEAVACGDGVCAAVSAVGCLADGLTLMTNFIPGPNVSTIITVPVSVGCKTFVWCCKRSKLPWGCRN
jgi:hypothetical protein